MQRFDLQTAPLIPWVNGAGTRQELAARQRDGHSLWWLSIAHIERDCAFSTFPGLARLHVIIAGNGTRLSGDGIALEAEPMKPVAFSGEAALDCRLLDGPCIALNVVYAPALVRAGLQVLAPGVHRVTGADIAVFCASGSGAMDGAKIRAGQGGVLGGSAVIEIAPGAKMLCAIMNPA